MKNQVVESGTCKTIIETTFSHFFGGFEPKQVPWQNVPSGEEEEDLVHAWRPITPWFP